MFDEFKNAFSRPNNGHIQLIIINVVVFLILVLISVASSLTGSSFIFEAIHQQLAIPALFIEFLGKPWTIITYAFVHDVSGIGHILFNMLAFYWFAKLIQEYLGNDKLIALYFLGAIAGGVTYLILYNVVPVFSNHNTLSHMVGASAAVYAVMVGAATLLPDYTFFLLFLGPVKIKYIALVLLVVSFIGLQGDNPGGNVAHLGGALIGFVYIKQLQNGVNLGGWITTILGWIRRIFKLRSSVKITYRKTESKKSASPAVFNKATQSEIDTILDKISDRGYESLTRDEKDKLFNASKKP
jgi:membrane associated rhomboid family serine protease